MLNTVLQLHSLFSRGSARRREFASNVVHTFDADNAPRAADGVATYSSTAEADGPPAACSTGTNPRWRTAQPRLRPDAAPHLRYPLGTSARSALDYRAGAHLHDTD